MGFRALAPLLLAVSAAHAQTRAFTGLTLIDGTDHAAVRNAKASSDAGVRRISSVRIAGNPVAR